MSAPLPRLNLIGAGRVGQTLAHLWHREGVLQVQDVLTRSAGSARKACGFIGAGRPVSALQEMGEAELWMLAVPDAQIASVADALAQSQPAPDRASPAPLVFHCSGAQSAQLLSPLADRGWHTGSAHCILSFATPALAVQQLAGTPCALEGEPQACARLTALIQALGARCFGVASEHKLLYHAAAVFATNFVPVLQQVAEEAWRTAGVPEPLVENLRQTLMAKAVANVSALGPLAALTGPAARQDHAAIARQAQTVAAWDAQAGAAYEALSALALRMAKASTETPATPASKS